VLTSHQPSFGLKPLWEKVGPKHSNEVIPLRSRPTGIVRYKTFYRGFFFWGGGEVTNWKIINYKGKVQSPREGRCKTEWTQETMFIRGLTFQVPLTHRTSEDVLLPPNSTVIKKGIPHHVVRLLQRPLTTLTPNNPRETTSQEEPSSTTRFEKVVEWLDQKTSHHRNRLPRAKVTSFRKELLDNIR
jgi:hypothetical protein